MKKRVAYRKFSRATGSRRALFRSLVRSLVDKGAIVTTKTKAVAVAPIVTKVVRFAKKGDLAARRKAMMLLGNDRVSVDKLFGSIAKAFEGETTTFVRTVNLSRRKGDGVQLARIEWTKEIVSEKSNEKGEEVRKKTSKRGRDKKTLKEGVGAATLPKR